MIISKRARAISPSMTLSIDAKAKQMQAEGIDVIGFGAGEPDFDTPDFIKQAAIKAINEGFTKYTPVSGIIELRKAVCQKLKTDNELNYDVSQILISCGAKHSLFNAIFTLCDDDDEVIIPAPYWVSYEELVKMAGATPVIINDLFEENGFKLTAQRLKEAITPKTKMLILNSPCNPTGAVYEKNELEELASIIVEQNIFVISDEIYEKIIYDDKKHYSIAAFNQQIADLTIVINGVSKSYSMTGWRIGYAAGHEAIITAMSNVQSHATSNPNSIAQKAALAAIGGQQDCITEMVTAFDRRRKYIVERLNNIEGISCPLPHGAFYVFPNISKLCGKRFNEKLINDSFALTGFLLDDARVAVVPGDAFGAPGYLRLSYATTDQNIKNGLDRIEEAVAKLK
ncbi:aspartate aminotransferase [Candidatus Desantisbacteria bacterium CG23_combo_of_CG06-09_8_20_14_all_40_23]|uniref:Aminotransferase n=1 Tax=Candidatus Desantisbacteria bacterium CG23_combo_of_CG06-09_8_20_14_all_40_23 TaxID=1974550 RepID=A0A2H0A6G1_9BACT|nr:MAG: aspartate aminotransferase [Candidatus Desantisbacteria bacterium CG23_combo_of_CG06-09_8_20_14_all_40_23]